MRLIHCSLRRASSKLRMLRRWRSGSTAAAISRRRRVKVEGAPPRIRIAMAAGCTCPAATAWYTLSWVSRIPGLTPVGKSLTMPTISYQRPDSTFCAAAPLLLST